MPGSPLIYSNIVSLFSSWPGLSRPSTSSGQAVVEILPCRVLSEYQTNFPGPRPVFHVPFALDGCADGLVMLEKDEPLEAISLCEPVGHTFAMLPCSLGKIACHSDIERPVWSIGHNVDPSAVHARGIS